MKITKFFALLCAAATLSFAACEPIDNGTNNGGTNTENPDNGGENNGGETQEGFGFTAEQTTVTAGTPIVFVVTMDGVDVTAESKIFNKKSYEEVANPLTIDVDGKYEFYAVYGTKISNVITISVVPTIPELPADSQPDNLAFNHHVLLVDHTGTKCGYCPYMMEAINEVAAMPGYHEKFYEAMSHTYNSDDPAWSRAAELIKVHYYSLISGYPTATFNFYHPTSAGYYTEDIKSQIDALWKAEGADVGVSAAVTGGNSMVVVTAGVKAKVAGDYRITAWLLEDGIYAPQAGTTDTSYYTHNNAVRNIATSDPITGYSLGTLEAGESATYTMTMDIVGSDWNSENLKVLVIATALNNNKRYEVANITLCPVGESVDYDYMK